MIPFQCFIFEKDQGKNYKNNEGNGFLNDF
jgi:hypothetical protein